MSAAAGAARCCSLLAVGLLAACTFIDGTSTQPVASGAAHPAEIERPLAATPVPLAKAAPGLHLAFVTDLRGANDGGLNALGIAGLQAQAQSLGASDPLVFVPDSPATIRQTVEQAASRADLVVGQGNDLADAFVAAAQEHSSVSFELIGASARPDGASNLRQTSFAVAEGARLAGMLAGGLSFSHVVAVVGSVRSAEEEDALSSYGQGAQSGDRTTVLSGYAGDGGDEAAAKRIAQEFIDRRADVVFAAGMPAGLGAIAAASQLRVLAIGFGRDQFDVAPNAVVSSVLLRTDVAASLALREFAGGSFRGGSRELGVGDGAVVLAPAHALSERIPGPLAAKLSQAAADRSLFPPHAGS